MKRQLTEKVYDNATIAITTGIKLRTMPARGARAVILAIKCDEAQTGTLQVLPASTEVYHADTTGGDDATESLTQALAATLNAFSSATTPSTSLWQYVTVYSNVANMPLLVPKYIRFRIVVATADLTKATLKLITLFDENGPNENSSGQPEVA